MPWAHDSWSDEVWIATFIVVCCYMLVPMCCNTCCIHEQQGAGLYSLQTWSADLSMFRGKQNFWKLIRLKILILSLIGDRVFYVAPLSQNLMCLWQSCCFGGSCFQLSMVIQPTCWAQIPTFLMQYNNSTGPSQKISVNSFHKFFKFPRNPSYANIF